MRKQFKTILLLAVFLNLPGIMIRAQVFTEISKQPQGMANSTAAWIAAGSGLNLLHSGELVNNKMQTKITFYKQTGQDQFSPTNSNLPAICRGEIDVADINKDGLPDVALTGLGADNRPVAGVYLQQSEGGFARIQTNMPGLIDGSIEFGDFDKDDDLDILYCGADINKIARTIIMENKDGKLVENPVNLPGVQFGAARWGDPNQNGYLDILLTGLSGAGPITRMYIFQNQLYRLLPQMIPGLKHSDCAWLDYNQDNLADFVISGATSSGMPYTRVFKAYKNMQFDELPERGMRQLMNCRIDISDFDADHDPDIVIVGESLERPYTVILENRKDQGFSDYMAGLTGVANGTARWGDYDGDGDYDLFVTGIDVCYNIIGNIYRNNLNPEIDREDENVDIFIESPIVDYNRGPYFYFVYSSCFCDLEGKGVKSYNMLISNVHQEKKDFDLNYKFNQILVNDYPGWGWSDRGHRTSNAFTSKTEAEKAREQVIGGYTNDNFKIHYINW